jgi:hypothetical protein
MGDSEVIFGVMGKRYPSQYDRSTLRLGALVFVEFDSIGNPIRFSHLPSQTSKRYAVTWIGPSDWYVTLRDEFEVSPTLVENTIKIVGDLLDRETVAIAIGKAASEIRPQYMFKTSELDRSRLSVISTVVERLELCSRLGDPAVAEQLFTHYRPLVVYLLLTCFDRLGQPADWIDFGAWLRATDKAEERMRVAPILNQLDEPAGIASRMYDSYNQRYGVHHSFFRFLRAVIPPDSRRELLDGIAMYHFGLPPDIGHGSRASDEEKEKFLFRLRNEYTHKARYVPGVTKSIWPSGAFDADGWEHFQQIFEKNDWTDIAVRNWPEAIEKTVRVGLAEYLEGISQE